MISRRCSRWRCLINNNINSQKRNFAKLFYNIMKWISNLIGLIVYVTSTYKAIGVVTDDNDIVDKFELSIAILFTIEYVEELYRVL
jgi:F0F1-type ATP synthase membrane subunit a